MISLNPIGIIKSPIHEARDQGWGNVIAELHLSENLSCGLEGIEQFSHLLILFWMHRSSFHLKNDLIRHPQGRADMPKVGIFAQRAKHHPNPIGLTAVSFLERKGNVLKVKGLDAIDGSPLLDIKPYYPAYDRIENPIVPEWVPQLLQNYF